MRIDRSALIRGLAAAAVRERERREAARQAEADAAGQWLIDKLDEMASRLRAAPDWREPTPEEQERSRQELNNWFREQGYDIEL